MYFVPGGRIGYVRDPRLQFVFNAWTANSADHTLRVDVTERIRLGRYFDTYLWNKDDRWRRIEPPTVETLPGVEMRKFRDLRYGDSRDYGSEAIVVRDETWMGELQVSTGDHGGRVKHEGGQARRWGPLMTTVLNSLRVRPRLAATDALAELNVSLDTTGLNPRLIGPQLILSLDAPQNAEEAWAANTPNIRLGNLSNLYPGGSPGSQTSRRDAINEYLARLARKLPGATRIEGKHCRGIRLPELTVVPGQYASSISAFGATRQQDIKAFYDAAHREPVLAAMDRVFQSLELRDWP
jgi:hypothetical protein